MTSLYLDDIILLLLHENIYLRSYTNTYTVDFNDATLSMRPESLSYENTWPNTVKVENLVLENIE